MRYILDSSVAVKWEVPEIDSDKAQRLRDDVRAGLHTVLAPDVYQIEVAHAFTRAERQGRIAVGAAAALLAGVMATPPQLQLSTSA